MPRGSSKPEMQRYIPGSGKLRKSDRQSEEPEPEKYNKNIAANRLARLKQDEFKNEDIETSTSKLADMSISDHRRRNRKPEQPLFVPTPVAKARETEQTQKQTRYEGHKNDRNLNGNNMQHNQNQNVKINMQGNNRPKRYLNRRGGRNDGGGENDEWRGGSPNRNYRQGSEPRGSYQQQQNQNSWNRFRDTRSVEPINTSNQNYNSEKSHMKPPSGRRHSTIGAIEPEKRMKLPLNIDHLPPRLRKKYLDDNKINHTEDSWDGSSITFQGNQQHYYQKQPYVSNQHVTVNNMIYCTLPSRGQRGRGRMHQEHNVPGMYRSMTPDKMYVNSPMNSRPGTPPNYGNRARSNENLNRGDSRSHTPVNMYRNDDRNNRIHRVSEERYADDVHNNANGRSPRKDFNPHTRGGFRESLEAQLSPISPPTPNESISMDLVQLNNDILDWSEEVELHSKHLDAEALSDALTRSSSMASLMETSTKSLPANPRHKNKKKKSRKSKRSGSSQRDRSVENQPSHRDEYQHNRNQNSRQRQNSHTSIDSNRDNFKVPEPRGPRRQSNDTRDRSFDRRNRSRNTSRESSFDRTRKSSCSEHESLNWREEMSRSRTNTVERELTIKKNTDRESIERDIEVKKAGLIHLPQHINESKPIPILHERPKLPDMSRRSPGQKTLYDPNNPHTPIVIVKPNSRVNCPGFSENTEQPPPQLTTTDQYGNYRPTWYMENSDSYKSCHYPQLLHEIRKADGELQSITSSGFVLIHWGHVCTYRNFLKESLKYLLCNDLKFSQTENIENYFWRILYHNIIEVTRKSILTDPSNKEQYKIFLLELIKEGTSYYEGLLEMLENNFKFKLGDYLGSNSHHKGTGYVNLALISAQKIFICLGDLGRYKEQVNETSNYGKCRQLYVKAHEINPKNGRPYNQLAVLAVYSRKKLDAVYYHMRSLMSTNPVQSARESLISLFDENRKKYEHSERKRREERQEKARLHMKEKESQDPKYKHGSLRKETWIRPDGGRRVHRTTSTLQEHKNLDSEEEDLASLTSVEVNKRFVTSYLHVHGKLITKIGMETFQETALQMLKEFRALLQHSPVPLPSTRFLQLLALNMFAIESTQLKDPQMQSGYKSEPQERALIVSLQMFSLILEKCVSLLSEHINSNPDSVNAIPQDAHELLPSVKIWCDWMLCHTSIWNPPPSTQDLKVGPTGDAWSRLASLMNLLEKLDQTISSSFVPNATEGYEQVRLPEDGALSGFTPLMFNVQESTYVPKKFDMEAAQFALRLNKLLFFGTVFLCGLEPPVLKLEYQNDFSEYVSVVCTTASRSTPNTPPEFNESELLVESFSDEEGCADESTKLPENASMEIQKLLNRKVELEKRHRDQELHRQTVQKILQQSVVSVHIEVKPKNLVPDTNCFVDYLVMLKTIAASNVYTLMVPLIVLNELEGLAKGAKSPVNSPRGSVDPAHVLKVAESCKLALEFLNNKHPCVKCITTKGTVLTSTTFTKEDDYMVAVNTTNDDRILATCMTLCKGTTEQVIGEPRKLYREVVLLTEDRNLRVKALARDVPVREVPSFLQWAGLG